MIKFANNFKSKLISWFVGSIIVVVPVSYCIAMNSTDFKTIKGKFLTNQKLTQNLSQHPRCVAEVGNNFVIKVHLTETNSLSLFRTESRYVTELLIELENMPYNQQRISVPSEIVSMCYKEGRQSLIFEAYEGQGWIQFEEVDTNKKQIKGNLNLVVNNTIHLENIEETKELNYHLNLKIE
jgi:hypothetical protein